MLLLSYVHIHIIQQGGFSTLLCGKDHVVCDLHVTNIGYSNSTFLQVLGAYAKEKQVGNIGAWKAICDIIF